MESILFYFIENKLKCFFEKLNIKIDIIACQKLSFDLYHIFYLIKIKFHNSRNEVTKKNIQLISSFFGDIKLYIDELHFLEMLTKLKEALRANYNNYYDSTCMNDLLIECINNFILNDPVYAYADKYKLLVDHINKMSYGLFFSFLDCWINSDEIFIEKTLES